MNKLSIVVPCYNEELNLPMIFEKFSPLFDNQNLEVLIVDNGSSDNSLNTMNNLAKQYEKCNFKIVHVVENKGYGFGITSGLNQASGDVLGWTHADLQTEPEDVIKGFEIFETYEDDIVVKGKRKNRNFLDAFFTYGMQIIASFALGANLDDVNAQPKIFSKKFYLDEVKKDAPLDFSLDLYLLYKAKKKLRIVDFPVFFKKRLHGEAKGGGSFKTKIKLIKRTFKYIYQLKNAITD